MQKLALVLASLFLAGFGRRVQPQFERLFAESQKLKQQGRRHADTYGSEDVYSQRRQPYSSHSPKFHRAAADVLRAASGAAYSSEAHQPKQRAAHAAGSAGPRQQKQSGGDATEQLMAMLQATRKKQMAQQEEELRIAREQAEEEARIAREQAEEEARIAREQKRIEEREAWLAEQVAWMASLPGSHGLEVEEEEYPHPEKNDDAIDGFWDNRGEFQQY